MPRDAEIPLPIATTEYLWNNAYWMARFSELAYKRKTKQNPAPDEQKILDELKKEGTGFRDVLAFNAESSQGVVIVHEDFVVAAMRGTDEVGDWLDNLQAWPAESDFGLVHAGFKRALDDIWKPMKSALRKTRSRTAKSTDGRSYRYNVPLWLTGHSLGGAMVTLAASHLVWADEPFYGVYTYGQPRVGDRDFARKFNVEAKTKSFRFQNNNDLVTRVPARAMGYSHVGTFVYISEGGELSRDMGWWYRFLDSVQGAVSDLLEIGIDGVKDHGIERYRKAIADWGDKDLLGTRRAPPAS